MFKDRSNIWQELGISDWVKNNFFPIPRWLYCSVAFKKVSLGMTLGKILNFNSSACHSKPCIFLSPEEGSATYSSILAWRIRWTEEPGGLESLGSQRVGLHWVTKSSTKTLCGFCHVFSFWFAVKNFHIQTYSELLQMCRIFSPAYLCYFGWNLPLIKKGNYECLDFK